MKYECSGFQAELCIVVRWSMLLIPTVFGLNVAAEQIVHLSALWWMLQTACQILYQIDSGFNKHRVRCCECVF